MNQKPYRQTLSTLWIACCLTLFALAVSGIAPEGAIGAVSVTAAVDNDAVSLGEPLMLQIQVQGEDNPSGGAGPDMGGLTDFSVESLGRRDNNSSSITIINGKVNRVETHGYVYTYRLIPKKTGQLLIPSIPVTLGSGTYHTHPIPVRINQPQTTDDFQLKVEYSKTKFYVGEPVLVTVTWYLAKDVQNVSFQLPFLDVDSFSFSDPKQVQDPSKQYFQIPFGQGTVLAEKGSGVFQGRNYTTLSFKKVLFASKAGIFNIPESTVSCKALVGYGRQNRRRNPFDDFFEDDFFSFGRRQVYKTFVASSRPVALTAVDLPQEGKPADFAGAVGSFRIETSASPTDVSVGDPITLTAAITGSDYLDHVELPPLSDNPDLARDFKIPEEMSPGTVKDGAKVFTQTLRAQNAQVKAIPAVKFAYFDPTLGRYEEASSKPIPIQVKPTRVVTAADIEGRAEPARAHNELEAWSQGIAHNYEGPDILEDRRFRPASALRSPLWAAGLILPFSGFLALFFIIRLRDRRLSDPDKYRSRKALAAFRQRLKQGISTPGPGTDEYEVLLVALRNYLGDKLRTQGQALTFADMERLLRDREIDSELISRVGEIFAVCEQGRYGGGYGASRSLDEIQQEAVDVVQVLDRKIG